MENYCNLFIEKMQVDGLSKIEIDNFIYNYNTLFSKEENFISGNSIDNPDNINSLASLTDFHYQTGKKNSDKVVMVKLNGGLGTSMGLKKAKTLLKVKDELTFLDIIAKQVEQIRIPLIFMNSFNTQKDTQDKLKEYNYLQEQNFDLDFLQSKVPKISVESGKPGLYPNNPELEWCPPGHGDIYTSMYNSGLLEKLLNEGIQYAFISNSDNLGATMDFSILGYLVENSVPFLMEAAQRTESDKKGGHLAVREDGKLILREIAQCPVSEIEDFQNFNKYTFFNTNNIWIDLKELKIKLEQNHGNMKLPVIQNKKNINPSDVNSEKVFQLETAMGSAIEVFDNSRAMLVDRKRFLPVKKTSDLLKIQSDLYYLDEQFNIVTDYFEQANTLVIDLDETYFKNIEMYQERIGKHKIGLKDCNNLKIKGNIYLKNDMEFIGNCELVE